MTREKLLSRVFVELADALVAEFDALDLLHTLTERSVELLHADAAGIILADQRGHLQVVASTSQQARLLEIFELQSSEGPCLDCFNTGQPMVNIDLDEVVARWPKFTAAASTAGYRATHALPLRLRDQVIGAMNLVCIEPATLSEDDIHLGQALADIATIGLLQARAVSQQELLAEQLQSALNSRILLEQAKGALSERARVDVDEAFDMMRTYSRQTRRRLVEVATAVIVGTLTIEELQPSQASTH